MSNSDKHDLTDWELVQRVETPQVYLWRDVPSSRVATWSVWGYNIMGMCSVCIRDIGVRFSIAPPTAVGNNRAKR